jgi:hypothetical protein
MNMTDITAGCAIVAPELLKSIALDAASGVVASEYIASLAEAILLALDAIANEDRARQRHIMTPAGKIDLGPASSMPEWATIHSLLNLLRDQAKVCGDLMDRIDIGAMKASAGEKL